VLLGVVLYVLRRLRHFVDDALERRYRARLDHLEIGGFKVLHAERLWGGLRGIVATAFWLLSLAVAYFALDFALLQFPGTRGFAVGLLDLILDPLARMGKGVVSSIPSLVFLALLVLVTRYVLKTLHLMFGAIEQGAVKLKGFDRDWTWPTYRIVRLLVLAFAVVVAFPYIPGSSSEAFKGVSLFLGIIFSLGSTSIIANIIAGYSMTYRRAFRVGDRIKVDDIVGEVTEARLQVTHVRSLKNEEVVIPNSVILNSAVVNYSTLAASKGLILHTTVGIGYETPWRQVEAMLLMAAERTPRLLKEPPPFVLQTSLGDFAITYELNAYTDRPGEMGPIYGEMHRNILDVFNEYGVAIMTPAYEGDPEQPKLVPKDRWYEAPAKR
jgi:small-conductance mechanosensitive channel